MIAGPPPPGAAPPLPAGELVQKAYLSLLANRDGLVRAGLVWLLAPLVLNVAATATEGLLLNLLGDVAAVLGLSALAVAWHRLVLLGEPLRAPMAPINGRVLRYVVLGFAVSLLAALPGALLLGLLGLGGLAGTGFLMGLALVAALVVAIGIFARLQLVFPGTAIGDRLVGLRGSWELTRGNGGRLLVGLLLTVLPVLGAVLLAQLIGAAFLAMGAEKAGAFLALLAASLGGWLQAPLVAAFLSYAYLFFRELAPGEAPPAPRP